MPDLGWSNLPDRAAMLEHIEAHFDDVVPGGRVLAKNVLGAGDRIDLVGVAPDGRAVAVLFTSPGEALAALALGLAQRAWLADRLEDWLQLNPELHLVPGAGVTVWLVGSDFGEPVRAAAQAVGPDCIRLVRLHAVRNGAGIEILAESVSTCPTGRSAPDPSRVGPGAPVDPEGFRTGLTDADLGLSDAEQREFQAPERLE